MKINSIYDLDKKYIYKEDEGGLMTKCLGEAAGNRKIYANIDYVSPKKYSTKYHSHSLKEEFFLILEGCGTLRINDEYFEVKKGDFISKVSGEGISHTFYNGADKILIILDVGTNETDDTCFYPDEDVYLFKSNEKNMAFSKNAELKDWTSDPNV